MKDSYFPHDYNPTNDPKIVCLIGKWGGLGYGLFWRITELLHQEDCNKLPLRDYIYEALANQMLSKADEIKKIINDCINVYELFASDNKFFWSERVLRNIKIKEEKRNKKSEAGKIGMYNRWHKGITKDNTVITKNNKHNKVKESKVKESKVKESKVKESKEELINLASSNYDGVKEIMDIFYKINPTLNWGNKTIRKACSDLIKKSGLEDAKKISQYAVSIQGEKYAPTIINPYQLWNKLAELKIYHDRQKNNQIQSL